MGRKRAAGVQSEAASTVGDRWEALRTAGYLADPQLERPEPRTSWHVTTLVVVAALLVAACVLPLLA